MITPSLPHHQQAVLVALIEPRTGSRSSTLLLHHLCKMSPHSIAKVYDYSIQRASKNFVAPVTTSLDSSPILLVLIVCSNASDTQLEYSRLAEEVYKRLVE